MMQTIWNYSNRFFKNFLYILEPLRQLLIVSFFAFLFLFLNCVYHEIRLTFTR